MYRVTMDNVAARRTLTPRHERHQATPYATFLDPAETGDIYSGMVLSRTGPDTVGLADGAAAPFGLAALDRNDVIDDMWGQTGPGVPFAVWIGGPDAFFEVDAPAFDDAQAYAVPVNGTRALLYSNAAGQLSSVALGEPVAELIEVISATRLYIRLLTNPQPAAA